MLVDVHLDEFHLALGGADRLFQHRRQLAARTAPRRPEVDQHRLALRFLDDVLHERLGGGFLDQIGRRLWRGAARALLYDCHGNPRPMAGSPMSGSPMAGSPMSGSPMAGSPMAGPVPVLARPEMAFHKLSPLKWRLGWKFQSVHKGYLTPAKPEIRRSGGALPPPGGMLRPS